MAGLLDIAPATERVTVRGTPVDVYGISVSGIVALLTRFPQLRDLMGGGDIAVADLLAMSGDVVAAIIAAGCGEPGNAEWEAVAAKLPLEAQADMLVAILRLTMPGGVGPFVDKLTSLGLSLNLQPSGPTINGHAAEAAVASAASSPPQ